MNRTEAHQRGWRGGRYLVLALAASVVAGAASIGAERAPAAHAEPSPAQYGIELRDAWIPMPDGVRLAADLYVPTGGRAGERFPVLLEYLPYRKTESRGRSYSLYSYFVRRGYLVARVDIRGTGNSEGRLIPYEYSDQENTDGDSVIAWLSKQSFSTGKVGMFGISWGGFNSIHMAMRNPPALKAIVAVDATDDLYQDDVHFMDGMIHVDSWEMSQDLWNLLPGAPDFTIDDAYFANRFETPPWMLTYKRQQRDGPFWKRTTLKERYDAIRIPAFLIGGFYDGYRDSVPRMLEHLKAPVKAIVGPWSHAFPHDAYPRPRIEWRHEAVRWFDHWLKGRDTGIMQRAALRGLRPPMAPSRPGPRGSARRVAVRRGLADPARARANAPPAAEPHARRDRARGHRAPVAQRPDERDRGGRPGDVVRRRGARPAAHRRLQPRLRHRPASRGPGDPRAAPGPPPGIGGRAARPVVRPPFRRLP